MFLLERALCPYKRFFRIYRLGRLDGAWGAGLFVGIREVFFSTFVIGPVWVDCAGVFRWGVHFLFFLACLFGECMDALEYVDVFVRR